MGHKGLLWSDMSQRTVQAWLARMPGAQTQGREVKGWSRSGQGGGTRRPASAGLALMVIARVKTCTFDLLPCLSP